jgi:transcriptional regulator with XRE-family HTH domain
LSFDVHTRLARKLGISASTLLRLENGEKSVTLGNPEDVMKRLNPSNCDVFAQDAFALPSVW